MVEGGETRSGVPIQAAGICKQVAHCLQFGWAIQSSPHQAGETRPRLGAQAAGGTWPANATPAWRYRRTREAGPSSAPAPRLLPAYQHISTPAHPAHSGPHGANCPRAPGRGAAGPVAAATASGRQGAAEQGTAGNRSESHSFQADGDGDMADVWRARRVAAAARDGLLLSCRCRLAWWRVGGANEIRAESNECREERGHAPAKRGLTVVPDAASAAT